MKAAITTLEIALHNLETNEPINRKAWHVEQADADQRNMVDIRHALLVLRVVQEQAELLAEDRKLTVMLGGAPI